MVAVLIWIRNKQSFLSYNGKAKHGLHLLPNQNSWDSFK